MSSEASPENPPPPSVTTSEKAEVGLLRSSAVVGALTMCSRVLGLARDIVFARFIGAAAGADAFFVAFKIPNFLRRLFAEGAFSQAFVPVLSEYREKGSHAAVRQLIDHVSGCLGLTLMLLTGLAILGAPLLTFLFAPGFHGDDVRFDLTSDMIKITFPYLLLISMTGLAGAILNSYDRFAIPAFTPVLLNVVLIAAAVGAAPWFDPPVMALAWGVLVAGVVQFVFQLPFLARLQLLPRPRPAWRDPGVKRILALMGPAIFGVSVSQINLLLDTILASFLPTGSVSWLYYSDRLSELPLGVFAIAIATVILPRLSRQHAGASAEQFAGTLTWALRMVLLIAVPAAVALILMASPILMTLFQYGETTLADIRMSSLSLQAYALGLIAFMLIKVLAPAFYARQDMRTPVKVGIIAMASNMVLNVICVLPLHHYWQVGHVGLALATSLSAMLNAGLLAHGLAKADVWRVASKPEVSWASFLGQLVCANMVLVVVLVGLMMIFDGWGDWAWYQRCAYLALTCCAGGGAYVLALLTFGLRPRHLRI